MDTTPIPVVAKMDALLSRCVSLDLEVDPETGRIRSFAAICPGASSAFVYRGGNIATALRRLDEYAGNADFVLGHNLIEFDLRHLEEANGGLQILGKPPVDTLWLNPLAFPRNPYHRLVKHYKDGQLQGGNASDPEIDAGLVLTVLQRQVTALQELRRSDPDTLTALHWLATGQARAQGFDAVFSLVTEAPRPATAEGLGAIRRILDGRACIGQFDPAIPEAGQTGWPLAYALSWISVAGENSVMPPWVRHQFPEAGTLVRRLRDTSCTDPTCTWCRSWSDPAQLLKQWFEGIDSFRPQPAGPDGRSLQETIVAKTLAKSSVLGILPTGTGKSLCYQLPALIQYHRTGALTVVISPLVALMADQVKSMERHRITSCVTVNGLLSLPVRHDALSQVRLGDAAMLLISPEQLRSPSVRSVLDQREVGYWVVDEAHCVSKWGHDFRPDYRYIARFIGDYSGDSSPAPVICLTATAKPGVIEDIREHFRDRLGIVLERIDGGARRENLSFDVISTEKVRKPGDIVSVLEDGLPDEGTSGAIVYCATRSATERIADFLKEKGFAAAHYHAGLSPEAKVEAQQEFGNGQLRVMVATNAFGMGIDKSDVRLVIHADIPGSIENYVQEAGRAGRDGGPARCVLLYSNDDIENQFRLSARSRLNRREIAAILKSLRRLDRRSGKDGAVVATPGEIVTEELDGEFGRDRNTDDTRVKIAVSWLEEATLLKRDENRVRVFPTSLEIRTLDEARERINAANISGPYRARLLELVRSLLDSPPDGGISTDELDGVSALTPARLRKALHVLQTLGIASNDTAITVFIHLGRGDTSQRRLANISALETDLVDRLRELAPDLAPGETASLNLRIAAQHLRDAGHSTVRPDILEKLIRSIARDGREDGEGIGSLRVRKTGRQHLALRQQRDWDKLALTAQLRRRAAAVLLASLTGSAPERARGKDVQVATTLGTLIAALKDDLELAQDISEPSRLLDYALLWLHEQGAVTLGRGLTIFRPAITVRLEPGNRRFTEAHFQPLHIHYDEQTLQTHIMAAYAERGLDSMRDAQEMMGDYFVRDRQAFLQKWLPRDTAAQRRQTTPESWRSIVEALGNPDQVRIVADERERTNVLVLAGPGSGKTRVLVHRIAYLVRIRQQDPRGILALVYNRHAATEIRRRLSALLGDDARGVTVSTCHGLAMRLVGASFARQAGDVAKGEFDRILRQAVSLLRGDGLPRDEAEALRETLIEGYRWILVDEYQDIGPDEYALISAVAGRSEQDEESRLSLFAVGDDDQNIYAFKGASVAFIRRFKEDYSARPVHLVENYRSTAHIVAAANRVIARAADRLKVKHDIEVDRGRRREPPGGELEQHDPVGRGRVQLLRVSRDKAIQAVVAVQELERLAKLDPEWDPARAAVIARNWRYLTPVRSYCEARGIPVQVASDELPNLWRLRETQSVVNWLRERPVSSVLPAEIADWIEAQPKGHWWSILSDGLRDLLHELGDGEIDRRDVIEWLAEWGRGVRERQSGLLLLTAHRAKGLEFDHVVLLDGGWDRSPKDSDADAERRLYYVAMTRARRGLALLSMGAQHRFHDGLNSPAVNVREPVHGSFEAADCGAIYRTLNPSEIDLDFVGRMRRGHPALDSLARLAAGDSIDLKRVGERWTIVDQHGIAIGRLARKYRPPEGAKLVEGRVYAITQRFRRDSAEDFQARLRRDEWSVVFPELVYRPLTELQSVETAAPAP
ncbi:MAG: RecQ family ATP-dependent DNA helicase [Rhodospirillales bacterium]|nr:RecQ family ATP-dependent DNA helicase [Rhodospirillales bacterium]